MKPLVLAAAAVSIGFSVRFAFTSSATFDEPLHLAAGYDALSRERFELNAMHHPPLAEMWPAVPLLALRPAPPEGPEPYAAADRFLYRNRIPAAELLRVSRIWNAATLTLVLILLLAWTARRLAGPEAAVFAAGAAAFCGPWAANAALLTTDALPALLFFAAFSALAARPLDGRSWALAGVLAGAAMGAKFSMAALLPIAAVTALAAGMKPFEAGRRLVLAGALAVLAVAFCYRFIDAGLWLRGFLETAERLSQGRRSYFLGSYSSEGWLLYFPAAILVKTPAALLAFAALGARWLWKNKPGERLWLLLPPALYLLAAMASKTQIGLRHVLPIYPFLFLLAGLWMSDAWKRGRRLLVAGGMLWALASTAAVSPHLLAYFNEPSGGPGRGSRWFVDSNLDWGQALPELAKELRRRGNPPVVLSYFGTADPAAEGIRYVALAMVGEVDRQGNAALSPGDPVLVAVSETNLAGLHYPDRGMLAWLRDRPKTAHPGWAIALYDLTGDEEGRRRLAALLSAHGRPGDAKAVLKR